MTRIPGDNKVPDPESANRNRTRKFALHSPTSPPLPVLIDSRALIAVAVFQSNQPTVDFFPTRIYPLYIVLPIRLRRCLLRSMQVDNCQQSTMAEVAPSVPRLSRSANACQRCRRRKQKVGHPSRSWMSGSMIADALGFPSPV